MYSTSNDTSMAPPQKPETFMLSDAAQQSLPQDAQVALQQVDNLKYFLISAVVDWTPDQYIRRFLLPTGEYVSCVLWNNLFHISGTDIVRCLSFRFQAFGRPVKNAKKFEEGIFSDLRNLKSGTDASLEEPKSAFLDFMYKNNCIRTQKKQKVFFWFSVPHDRLFLDALERDLKREKMGQEATTMAVNEPALSFEFDSSQSLFEQLTKAQQANTSSFSANAGSAYSQSTSPVLRAVDSMPPPSSLPQSSLPTVSEDVPAPMDAYQQSNTGMSSNAMTNVGSNGGYVKRETDYGLQQYDRNGIPLSRVHQRHTSMPTYMEYASPAPSFVSSQGDYGGYSNRELSFEPVTPPQHGHHLGNETTYIANEETGLYSAIPDVHSNHVYNPMLPMQSSSLGPYAATSNGMARAYNGGISAAAGGNGAAGNPYTVIEGSPTYKQRRRRSSIPLNHQGGLPNALPHAPHRQSDLRRSVSVSVGPEDMDQATGAPLSPPALPNGYANMVAQHKDMLDQLSRHGTPMQVLEGSPAPSHMGSSVIQSSEAFPAYAEPNNVNAQLNDMNAVARPTGGADRPGPVRRARSATLMELGPYPHKSHSCPIPTCGRLFKRLEHLKRHVRTHTQERPYVCPHCNKAFSRSDNLAQHRRTHEARPDGEAGGYTDDDLEAEENEFGTLEEESSPPPEHDSHGDPHSAISTHESSHASVTNANNLASSSHINSNSNNLSNGMSHSYMPESIHSMSMNHNGTVGSMGPPMMNTQQMLSQQI